MNAELKACGHALGWTNPINFVPLGSAARVYPRTFVPLQSVLTTTSSGPPASSLRSVSNAAVPSAMITLGLTAAMMRLTRSRENLSMLCLTDSGAVFHSPLSLLRKKFMFSFTLSLSISV